MPRFNTASATFGLSLFSLPRGLTAPLSANSAFVASDITNAFRVSLMYERIEIYRKFPLLVAANLIFGSRSFENSLSTQAATGKIFAFSGGVGSGYEFEIFPRISIRPYFLLGYLAGAITMSAPNEVDRKLDVSGLTTFFGATAGYLLRARITLGLNLGYESVYYADGVSGAFLVATGAAYAF